MLRLLPPVVLLSCLAQLVVDATAKASPHILFVVADDFGFNDIALRDGETTNAGVPLTPTLNSLAESGILLDNYYVQPSCSPSRACFMSGRYPLHTGINNWLPNEAVGLPLDEVTLADLMKEHGYSTHAIGKWHLGFYNWASTPTFRGFDSFYGFYEGSEDYFKHTTSAWDLHREPTPRCGAGCSVLPWADNGTYSAFLFSDEAQTVIKANRASPDKQPLFIYLAYQSVHAPAQAPQSYIDMFSTSLPGDEYKQRRTFAGMVHCMDEGLGNVTKLMKTEGMWTTEEPTIIVFTDENGAPTDACAQIGGNNLPHRGKCSIWEGGTKGISIVASPLLTKTNYTYHGLAHAVDWLPTLVAGALSGSTASTKPLDGHDLWAALLSNDPSKSSRTDIYYGITDSSVGIYGPALRSADGMKIIIGGWGGGNGQYKQLNDTYTGAAKPPDYAGSPAFEVRGVAMSTLFAEAPLLLGGADLGSSGSASCSWNVTVGKCCPGDSFMSVAQVKDTATCCALCAAHKSQGCTSFTMNKQESTCWLKTGARTSHSGDCDCGHTGPLPPNAPPAPPHSNGHPANDSKILLYNVEADTEEMIEISTEHADIVAKLKKLVTEHEKTGVPQATPVTQNTTHCGNARMSQDNSTTGGGRTYWGPWC